MARDLSDVIRKTAVGAAADLLNNLGDGGGPSRKKSGRFSGAKAGAKGLAAGAGLVALAPLAKKGFDALTPPGGAVSSLGGKVGDKVKDTVSDKVDEAGGAGGIAKDALGGGLGGGLFGGDSDDGGGGGNGMPGVGKGRRMPVQQAIDVAVPRETAYNQFTQFEDWPEFMHRVTRVSQEDECSLSFATKIWGKTKEFKADIETQRPDERIKWSVSEGITHSGVVTFHELAPELTRIEVNLDVDPGGLLEKAARGMRHIKRAVRADLHRFKAFIEMQENETGAWRGVIEDGELVEDHDESYDEEREYSDVEDLQAEADSDSDSDEEPEEDEEAEEQPEAEADESDDEEEEAEEEEPQPARAQRSRRSSSSRRSSNGGSPSRSRRSRSRAGQS